MGNSVDAAPDAANVVKMRSVDALEVEGLTKLYGDVVAVSDLSFRVQQGKIVGLVGPNGAGKTTTLRAIAGIHPPTSGSIRVCGFDLAEDPVEAKRRTAFMPDEPKLFDYLTVEEHLRFVSRVYGVEGWREKATALLDELEMTDRRASLPSELSRGMKQKLIIACGLIHEPSLLIFDEPLTGLDPLGIRRMKDTIRRRTEAGASVLLSSHLLHLVEELCDSIVIIHRGRKIAAGTARDLRTLAGQTDNQTLEDAFLTITRGEGGSERGRGQ